MLQVVAAKCPGMVHGEVRARLKRVANITNRSRINRHKVVDSYTYYLAMVALIETIRILSTDLNSDPHRLLLQIRLIKHL